MFVILNGEAQFTIDGRTARGQGTGRRGLPRGPFPCAILNTGTETLQWMNINVTSIAGVGDAFDLGDTREHAVLDPVPTFMSARIWIRELLRAPGAGFGRGRRDAAPTAPATEVRSRRVLRADGVQVHLVLRGPRAGATGRFDHSRSTTLKSVRPIT